MKKAEDIMWRFLKEMAQGETVVDYVVQELRQYLGEDAPTAEEVRRSICEPSAA